MLEVYGVGILVLVLGALRGNQALSGEVRQVAPCEVVFGEVGWAEIFPGL